MNNKLQKYYIEPTRLIMGDTLLSISVNDYDLNHPDVPYPKNMDLVWDTSVVVFSRINVILLKLKYIFIKDDFRMFISWRHTQM